MRRLKIDNNKGYFTTDGKKWVQIDRIGKDDLLLLLDLAIEDDDFEMDDFDAEKLANKAHQIIYKEIHEKLADLRNNRDRFRDESQGMYEDAINKYSAKEGP